MATRNRGKNSEDDALLGTGKAILKLNLAIKDMHYLLSRGYSEKTIAELVGNRYKLRSRQIQMLKAASASDIQIKNRRQKLIEEEQLLEKTIYLDGFNILILLESLLSGAYIFKGLDGAYRDLSGVHGTYKRVKQTNCSIELIEDFSVKSNIKKAIWVFDRPVYNSGRIKEIIYEYAKQKKLNWEVILENNPDKYLVDNSEIVISSDAWILDNCKFWFNLPEYLLSKTSLHANSINLSR